MSSWLAVLDTGISALRLDEEWSNVVFRISTTGHVTVKPSVGDPGYPKDIPPGGIALFQLYGLLHNKCGEDGAVFHLDGVRTRRCYGLRRPHGWRNHDLLPLLEWSAFARGSPGMSPAGGERRSRRPVPVGDAEVSLGNLGSDGVGAQVSSDSTRRGDS